MVRFFGAGGEPGRGAVQMLRFVFFFDDEQWRPEFSVGCLDIDHEHLKFV